jgi:hypothetical protein
MALVWAAFTELSPKPKGQSFPAFPGNMVVAAWCLWNINFGWRVCSCDAAKKAPYE